MEEVEFKCPPPKKNPNPLFQTLKAGSFIRRIFDPTKNDARALTFRHVGVIHRFDHHRIPPAPVIPIEKRNPDDPDLYEDLERGIYYAGLTLSCCIVECFGDEGVIELKDKHVCLIKLNRDLNLLDIRRRGAMRAGSVAALAKITRRDQSQEWSRYFYEDKNNWYGKIDGISYLNAHNDEESFALYERSADAFSLENTVRMRLDNKDLIPAIQQAAIDHDLDFPNEASP